MIVYFLVYNITFMIILMSGNIKYEWSFARLGNMVPTLSYPAPINKMKVNVLGGFIVYSSLSTVSDPPTIYGGSAILNGLFFKFPL